MKIKNVFKKESAERIRLLDFRSWFFLPLAFTLIAMALCVFITHFFCIVFNLRFSFFSLLGLFLATFFILLFLICSLMVVASDFIRVKAGQIQAVFSVEAKKNIFLPPGRYFLFLERFVPLEVITLENEFFYPIEVLFSRGIKTKGSIAILCNIVDPAKFFQFGWASCSPLLIKLLGRYFFLKQNYLNFFSRRTVFSVEELKQNDLAVFLKQIEGMAGLEIKEISLTITKIEEILSKDNSEYYFNDPGHC